MFILLLRLLVNVALVTAASPIAYSNKWGGAFQGNFTIHADHLINGWIAHLVFDQPLDELEVWKGTVINKTDGREWVIENMPWDGNLNNGDDLIIDFIGRYSGETTPVGTFYVEGLNGGGPGSVTAAPGPLVTTTHYSNGGNQTSHDYGEALKLSILFYDAQRSGKLPDDNPIPWRGDSALNDGDKGHDLTGGWYDAGDHVKFNLPMSYSTWVLEWGFLKFRDGYEAANQTDMMCDMIKWPLEYFLKCWIPDQQTLYVQVGDGNLDHHFWGRPENMNMSRPAYKVNATCPGSDVAADTASAMAAGYQVFTQICGDDTFAAKLLDAAKSLYKFGKTNRGIYSRCVTEAAQFYSSSSDNDDLAVAASWLYKVTKDSAYLKDAESFHQPGPRFALSWDDQMMAADLLLYELTGNRTYKMDMTMFMNSYMPDGYVPITPCGLVWRDMWGANRYAANAAFIALLSAADGINPDAYKKWALSQINYMLGDNNYGISYEIGYGNKYPTHPHHRGSSCSVNTTTCSIDDPGPNAKILLGALVGGPDKSDNYEDRRADYTKNEVATDYNAGFQGALAGLMQFASSNALPPAQPAKCNWVSKYNSPQKISAPFSREKMLSISIFIFCLNVFPGFLYWT